MTENLYLLCENPQKIHLHKLLDKNMLHSTDYTGGKTKYGI